MGIFSNIKINSLRKKIEAKYESRIEEAASLASNLPEAQKWELIAKVGISIKAGAFVKEMNHSLFHPDGGIFKDDIGNLDEGNFERLYEIMAIWFLWMGEPLSSEGVKNQDRLDRRIDLLETGLGIKPQITRSYYDGLAGMSNNLAYCALYRWCMLTVGHNDIYYETMHENSPDCKTFADLVDSAAKVAERALD